MKIIKELERGINRLKAKDPFDEAASNLIICIAAYCSEAKINLTTEDGKLNTDLLTRLIEDMPKVIHDLDDSSDAKQYFNHHFGQLALPLLESIKTMAMSVVRHFD
ncbi:hypothetical protein ACTHP5_20025 [Bacillus subtilis]|uniref:Uncharacterized protein n=1 Tax=Bacillus subtilis TaxID=1423 RepID=B7U5A9_BACIU|nr:MULTISPECIES: hypothetical protein [Bacillus]ACJ66912.1 hypothetical protein Bsb_32 [Bacillus subtilis]APB62319.1 hypothetical protein pBS72_0500 [Bacillus subtilis]MEC3664953.1 hypothetical protein [Bacillus subtilis]NUF07805.1 hypothetical protein [Bacillus rugosus]ODV48143.1 hypothetical protein BCM26_04135 [Bacillus subtilis]